MKKFKSPEIHRTPLYRARRAYRDMIVRCGNASGKNPTYANVELRMTMEEWLAWSVPQYECFLKKHPNESPSVSRFGDKGHYEISNLEIITLLANRQRMAAPYQLKPDGTKKCGRCEQTKVASDFYRATRESDGLQRWCTSCRKKHNTGSVTRAAMGADS
jgi:hypothetical protein